MNKPPPKHAIPTPPIATPSAYMLAALDAWMLMHAAKGTYLMPTVLVSREQFLERYPMQSDD